MKQRGLLDLSLLGLSNLLVKPLWFLFLIAICPRILGPEGYGQMQTALALAVLVLSATDLGLTNFTLREVARRPSRSGRFFQHVLPYRAVALGVASLFVLLIGGTWIGATAPKAVYAGAAAYIAGTSLSGTMTAFYRARNRLDAEALATAVERFSTIGAGALALWWTRSAAGVLIAMATSTLVAALVQGTWIRRRLAADGRSRQFRIPFVQAAVWAALPLGVADLFLSAYMRSGQLAVDGLLGAAAAGQYAQAYRIVEMLSLLPALVVQGYLFSRLSALDAADDPVAARRIRNRTIVWLTLSATLIAMALSTFATPLIHLLSGAGDFDPAGDLLEIMAWMFPIICIKDIYYISFISSRRHVVPALVFALSALLNVVLLLTLIPRVGLAGAAMAAVAVEAGAAATLAIVYHRHTPPRARSASEPFRL